MAYNARNFVIERLTRALMVHSSDGSVLWSLNQIKDPSLSITTEEVEALDSLSTPIMAFERGKKAEFSATNAIFDLDLAAAQFGTVKKSATAAAKIAVPIFVEVTAPDPLAAVTLPKTPKGSGAAGIKYIYKLSGDGALADRYEYAATADASHFTFTGTALTLPTGTVGGAKFFVSYEYEADDTTKNGAIAVDATANDFPTAGKLLIEGIFYDPCDVSAKHYGMLVFPNAKLSSATDLPFTTEGGQAFTIKCAQNYCDTEKKLFSIIIPE